MKTTEIKDNNGNVIQRTTGDYTEYYTRNELGIITEYKDSTGYSYKTNKTINEVIEEHNSNLKSFLNNKELNNEY